MDDAVGEAIYEWFMTEKKIPQTAVTNLLCKLQQILPSLPLTCETLLSRFSVSNFLPIETFNTNAGKYCYWGIQRALSFHLKDYVTPLLKTDEGLLIKVGIDGISLSKSSCVHAWPTLVDVHEFKTSPTLVGLFVGQEKPNKNDLLRFMTEEIASLQRSRLLKINHMDFKIRKLVFICDAPARSMIKSVKSHTGYFSCERYVVFIRTHEKYTQ